MSRAASNNLSANGGGKTKVLRPVFEICASSSKRTRREIGELYSFRLTPSEKTRLKEKAGRLPVSVYIRQCTLGEDAAPRRKLHHPSVNQKAIAQLLGVLGQSRLASNMNQIAKAANMGALPVTDDLMVELTQACADIAAMRQGLITALGITAKD